jgi:hypothetical protein
VVALTKAPTSGRGDRRDDPPRQKVLDDGLLIFGK